MPAVLNAMALSKRETVVSEDYTYEPVKFVSVPSDDLAALLNEMQAANQRIADLEVENAALLKMRRKVERAYDLYRYNAEYVGVEPLSFAEWFDMVSGENEELPESIIANGDVLLDNIAG